MKRPLVKPDGIKAPALGNMANVDLDNTSHTFQQILARKMGYTKYLDSPKLNLHERINDFY